MDSRSGKPLLEGRRPPRRDDRSPPPELWVGCSSAIDCVGAEDAGDVVGRTISDDGGKTPVEASAAEERVGADSTSLEVVGRTIADKGGRTPVEGCATGVLVAVSLSMFEVVGRTMSEGSGKPEEGC